MISQYLLMFITAFGAATLLPFYSEILLVAQLNAGLSPAWLWVAATLGNTLGAGINWWMGMKLSHYSDRKWFPARKSDLIRAQNWFTRYGKWTLLMSWMPIGGDALTVVGGIMRISAVPFFILVGIGKGLRYALVIGGVNAL
ncbi:MULTISPECIES: YqaA family protein [Zhongshania]|jgi:membrane protein YqaA with SNARE-associated domain|uniref:DedA family protein n=1 Tax=Zhongshania aquimaris TaxID=2857107 RepID=A0ABS6VNB4_9GAMM|nr:MULTISPECIES: YqaA family protein [Zhongshania]MBQ0795483.1 DedA family protein [Zhongshania sp.]MBW2939774.1 DedA family protein [Zhongshania aquimaris]|tara:strand:+ start:527 stop:952 length:426 start_codon:yes stop_codon:yes gene_type:complete